MKKSISIFLIFLCLWMTFVPVCFGEEKYLRVTGCNVQTSETGKLYFLPMAGNLYIDEKAVLAMTGFQAEENITGGSTVFRNDTEVIDFSGMIIIENDLRYFPMKELMDRLRTSYRYSTDEETLYFYHNGANFDAVCDRAYNIFNSRRFDIQLDDSGIGAGFARIYNIIGDFRTDALWGGYEREQIQNTAAGLITMDENQWLKMAKDAQGLYKKMNTLYRFGSTDLDGTHRDFEILGMPYGETCELYEKIDGMVPGIGIDDAFDIAEAALASRYVSQAYARGLEYAVLYGENLTQYDNIYIAAKEVYDYYDQQKPKLLTVTEDLLLKSAGNMTADAVKEVFVKEVLGIHSPYVKMAKLIMDLYGMKNKTKAVEETHVCMDLQKIIREEYEDTVSRSGQTDVLGEKSNIFLFCI